MSSLRFFVTTLTPDFVFSIFDSESESSSPFEQPPPIIAANATRVKSIPALNVFFIKDPPVYQKI